MQDHQIKMNRLKVSFFFFLSKLSSSSRLDTLHNAISKSSIYAIATNAPGTLLASGSPEKVIRLWDPRSGERVGKLTGHTDNIRALLMSEDGKYVSLF